MKIETNIAKENVYNYKDDILNRFGKDKYKYICQEHLKSCQRNVKKRERDYKYLHKLIKEGIRGNHFLRYVDRIDNELNDNKNAIKVYEDGGIK